MAKIFTKLNLADIVATSGGKSFRKLSTEEPIPIWNGTDLTGTTWQLNKTIRPIGNAATFKVTAEIVSDNHIITLPYTVSPYTYDEMVISDGSNINTAYFKVGAYGGGSSNKGYFISYWAAGGWFGDIKTAGWRYHTYNYSPSVPLDSNTPIISAPILTITGGIDATNTNLIAWLKQNGELTSHKMQ